MAQISIRTRLIIILSILLLFGFFTTNIISYNVSKELVRKSIIGNSLPLARDNIYSEIQRDLMRPIFVSSLMANDTFLKGWVLSGERDITEITRYLAEVKKKYGFFTSFFVSENTGNYYHFTGVHKIISQEDVHDNWYYDFKMADVEYDLDVDTNEAEHNRLTIFINHRLTDYDGKFLGVVGVGLNFDMVAELLASYKKKYDRNVYMVDSDGLIQVHTAQGHILQTNIFRQEGIQNIADKILAAQSEPSFFEYDAQEQHILITSRYVNELKWYLLVEQNQTQAMAAVNTSFIRNIIFSLVTIFCTILVTILVINYFQKQLEEMAIRDKLTNAFNRNEFERRYSYLEGMAKRKLLTLSLILFDIDNLKQANDSFGHIFGDAVIREIAQQAFTSIRENDLLVRWGGDEFIILILGDLTQAEMIGGRLSERVNGTDFSTVDSLQRPQKTPPISISCGIALRDSDDTLDSLIHRADKALYLAKSKGRNCIVTQSDVG